MAARRSARRPHQRGVVVGRLRDPLPQAPRRRAHRGPAAARRHSLPPRARPLTHRGRSHRLRDLGASRRPKPGRPRRDAHLREKRAVGAFPPGGRGRAQREQRLLDRDARARGAAPGEGSGHAQAVAAHLSAREPPEAVALAEKMRNATEISFAPKGGVEIALRGMLAAAGFRRLPSTPTGIVIAADALTVFKALQLLDAEKIDTALDRYVTFDFETTDTDVETCGVVEIGAVRVVNGEIVDRFHAMVNPFRAISPKATADVHGYSDADVRDAPSFAEIWPAFREFVGDDLMIAHNGMNFDVPVLRRLAAGRDGLDTLAFYDTLPLVRSLSQDSAKQDDIAHRFGIDCGRAHHALDDAITLAHVYRELQKLRAARARKAVLSNVLDYLGLALALEHGAGSTEQQLLFNIARYRTLGRYSDALEFYAASRTDNAPTLDDVIQRLGGKALMAKLHAQRDPSQRYATAVARLNALIGEGTLEECIDLLLERVALSTSEGVELAPDRVNLLTLHSTKGLEFSRVYILGVEDYEIPGYQAATNNITDEIEEARLLLYVGMTRARDRLVLTRVERRFGRDTGGSSFLEEMGLLPRPLHVRDPNLRPALLG